MDTRLSSAVHMLILIARSEKPMTSGEIAASVGTNPSHIRRLTGLLKHAGLIESRQGRSGFALAQKPEDIALLDIWRAVTEEQDFHIFDLHQNPNDACIVGRNIRPVLGDIFSGMEREVEAMLAETTLADCISRMEKRVEKAGQNEKEDAR